MVGTGFAVASILGTAGQFASGILSAQARQGEFAEQLRRLEQKKRYTIGLATAKTGASGVEFSSASTQHYLASLTSEFDRAIAATRDAKSLGGVLDTFGIVSGGISNLAGMAGTLGKANNWWETPANPMISSTPSPVPVPAANTLMPDWR